MLPKLDINRFPGCYPKFNPFSHFHLRVHRPRGIVLIKSTDFRLRRYSRNKGCLCSCFSDTLRRPSHFDVFYGLPGVEMEALRTNCLLD